MSKSLLKILFFVTLLFISSCEKDKVNVEDSLIGTWQQTSLYEDGNVVEDEFVSATFMYFDSNGIMKYHDGKEAKTTRSGWSYKDEMLNIAIFMPAGLYVEDISNELMTLRRVDFAGDRLQTTVSNWKKVENNLFPKN